MVFTSPVTDYTVTPMELAPTAGLLDDARAMRDNVTPYLATIGRLVAMMNAMTRSMAENRPDSVGDSLDDATAIYASFAPAWLEAAQGFENVVSEELLPRTLIVERGAIAFLRLEEEFWKNASSREAYLASTDLMSQAATEYVPMLRELAETVRSYGRLTGPLVEPGARLGAALDQVANLFGDVASLASRLRGDGEPPA
jgi:ABC-type transporter Mla subunit MlaD